MPIRREEAIRAEKQRIRNGQMTGLGRLVLYYETGYTDCFQVQDVASMKALPAGVDPGYKLTPEMRTAAVSISWKSGVTTDQCIFARVEKGNNEGALEGQEMFKYITCLLFLIARCDP